MARPSELHFRAADTWLCGNFSISVQKKNLSVQKICCTTVTQRTLAKVLSLSTWGNSYPRTKRKLLSIILKIPPFSYALLWFQVVVPSCFGARLWHAHTLFSAVKGTLKYLLRSVCCNSAHVCLHWTRFGQHILRASMVQFMTSSDHAQCHVTGNRKMHINWKTYLFAYNFLYHTIP